MVEPQDSGAMEAEAPDALALLAANGMNADLAVSIFQDAEPCPATESEFAIQLLQRQLRRLEARIDALEKRK